MDNLLLKTIELANNTNLSHRDICKELCVSERWYYKVMSGKIKNPGVIHIQALYNLLNRRSEGVPADEKAMLQKEFIAAQKNLSELVKRMESFGFLKDF